MFSFAQNMTISVKSGGIKLEYAFKFFFAEYYFWFYFGLANRDLILVVIEKQKKFLV
jgi:hypothetical protein